MTLQNAGDHGSQEAIHSLLHLNCHEYLGKTMEWCVVAFFAISATT